MLRAGEDLTGLDLCRQELSRERFEDCRLVGADLSVMEAYTQLMRGARPYVFASLRSGDGADALARFVEEAGGLGL